jgi:hypothetical protein
MACMNRRPGTGGPASHSTVALLVQRPVTTDDNLVQQYFEVLQNIILINELLNASTPELTWNDCIRSQDMSGRDKTIYCQVYAAIGQQTAIIENGTGVPLAINLAILSEGLNIC